MDSKLFEGVSEMEKSQFVGNFFHFTKCRFQDCNLVQTSAKINTSNPTGAESKKIEDVKNLHDWGSGKGNHVAAFSEGDKEYVQTGAKVANPSGAESKKTEDEKNLHDWGSGKGNHVPAFSAKDTAYVQTSASNSTAPAAPAQK